jgi:hypothetical protein
MRSYKTGAATQFWAFISSQAEDVTGGWYGWEMQHAWKKRGMQGPVGSPEGKKPISVDGRIILK